MKKLVVGHVVLIFSLFSIASYAAPSPKKDFSLNITQRITQKSSYKPTYLSFQYAQASEVDFINALGFDFGKSPESGAVTALSIGKKIAESVLGYPITVVAYGSFQHLHENSYQPDVYGTSVYVKAFHHFTLPTTQLKLRVGLAEGLSYVSRVPVAEKRDFARKGAESVKLMNYLEYSLDLPISQFLKQSRISSSIDEIYVGYSIWHRSTAYGLYGETGGGINYQGIAIELLYR